MTPAIRLLETHHIDHKLHSYTHNSASESYGLEAAQALDLATNRVFKTLVVSTADKRYLVGIVPVSGTLNLKNIASIAGAKKATMADKAKVQILTGYVIGGVSPLGQKKQLKTVIDLSAFEHQTIFVSAGKRGLDVELSPIDLESLCSAERASIANI